MEQGIEYGLLMWVITSWISWLYHRFQLYSFIPTLCPKCTSFWLTLAFTLNPFTAALAAFMVYMIDKYITTSKTTL